MQEILIKSKTICIMYINYLRIVFRIYFLVNGFGNLKTRPRHNWDVSPVNVITS